ncbi:hypothetical protein MTO96_043657 [Rhipicephalus appendiculatus]
MLRSFCHRSKAVFFIDHGFEWIPAYRVLAADGLHPSFEGSSLIASHIRQLFSRRLLDATSSWCDHATEDPPTHTETDFETKKQGVNPRSELQVSEQPSPE